MDIDKTTTIEKKIHCVATLDDNFKDDSVIVVLDNQISEINKVHSLSFFSGIEIDRIEDLTKRDSHNSVETENFRQILQIFLKNQYCYKDLFCWLGFSILSPINYLCLFLS